MQVSASMFVALWSLLTGKHNRRKDRKKGSKQLTCQVDKKFKLSCMVVLGFAPTSTDCHCVCKWCAFELEPNSSWAKSANIQIAEFAFVPHRFSESIHFHPSYLCKYVILIMPSFLLSMDLFSWILSTFCQCSLPMFATFSVLLCAALPPPPAPNLLLRSKKSTKCTIEKETFFGYRSAFSVSVFSA